MSTQDRRRKEHKNLTLAGPISLISNDPGLGEDRGRWCTAIRGIARALGKPAEILPADPARLMKLVTKNRGVRHHAGVKASTWRTYKAQYCAATRHVGLASGPARVD